MLTLAQLTAPLSIQQVRQQLLDGLQGRGVVTKTGTGTGSASLSGTPVASYSLVVHIVTGGEPGMATYWYSLDGGTTLSATASVPSSGAVALGASGVSVAFAAGPAGSGTSFVAGDEFRAALASPNFPASSWQAGSVPRTLLEIEAQGLSSLLSLVSQIALGGYVTQSPGVTGAAGSWLDLVAQNVYGLTRNPALATQGVLTLTDAGGAGPFTVVAGQLWFASTNGLRYTNTAGGTLSKSGTLQLAISAESPGSAYNVANLAISTMLTPLPGVTVSNPDPGGGTWITLQQGTDAETDLALSTRCQGQWSALGKGATAATYDLWARTASAEVTRTKVVADGTTGGQVDIYLAGASGAVSGAAVTAVQNYVAPRLPTAVTQSTAAATNQAAAIAGTVYVYTAQSAAAQAAVATNLAALIQATPVGGTLYLSAVIRAIGDASGVRNSANVTINAVAADLVLTSAQVATLTNSLAFTNV